VAALGLNGVHRTQPRAATEGRPYSTFDRGGNLLEL